ncbi:MJ0042-type zinc finger domain-containing protein [uncultured Bradyrhizobium sp.]|uniref:MJ0042-type zinc finger domain-containing protein n=1 Tax=uncultured Bradyrhizobium sp. TaxID=199684 RepID=UPI0035CAA7C9
MHIICPHCTTSYAIDPTTLGAAGRTVRCSRCKKVWLARPEDTVVTQALMPSMAESGDAAPNSLPAAGRNQTAGNGPGQEEEPPLVESPSISAEWPVEPESGPEPRPPAAAPDAPQAKAAPRRSLLRRLKPSVSFGLPTVSLATVCAAMGALLLALMIWRTDVVRLLPQTAAFYKAVGLEVNLRGLVFKDVKVSSENVEGKPVLVIEGVVIGQAKKTVELPRLRFSVRDAQGAEIYAWNAVLEQPVLKPGEKAWFKSRLASPPPEGRNIDVRFFNKRDIAGGGV